MSYKLLAEATEPAELDGLQGYLALGIIKEADSGTNEINSL
jgi:hypothetical protein